MLAFLWILLAFLSGSLPFSVWVGKRFLKENIRSYGDGNPGATNVVKAGGWYWGALAAVLDVLKALLPVGLAYFVVELRGWPMVAVALAPIVGHAFSPFLGGHGGKALATTIGSWGGLTLAEGPLVLGLFLTVWELLLDSDGWAVMLGMASLLGYLLLTHRDPLFIGVWLGNALLLAWTHRHDLARRPSLRPWLHRIF